MGLAGPVTGDADEEDGAVTAEEGGDASAGLSLPLLKSLSIFLPFSGYTLFSSLFLRFWATFMSGFSEIVTLLFIPIDLTFSFEAV